MRADVPTPTRGLDAGEFPAGLPVPTVEIVVERADRASGPTVIAVAGELDRAGAQVLTVRLIALLCEREPVRHLVVDLSEVSYLDAGGLAALAGAHERAMHAGTMLEIVVPDRHAVLKPLQVTGLLQLLPIRIADPVTAGAPPGG